MSTWQRSQMHSQSSCKLRTSSMAISRQTTTTHSWLTKLTKNKKDLITAAVGLSLILFSFSFIFKSSSNSSSLFTVNSDFVPLTLLHSAKHKGALCLDGSLPAYHFQKGFGSGSQKWLLHLEGGGWCDSIATCALRKATALGSSNHMERVQFSGILSHDRARNPDFFNWNKVKVRYCDGSSFAGHPESEFHNGTHLFFRGHLIWQALMDELLAMGMANAGQALLSGCSAGGLATMIHCDDFRVKLPKTAVVKCLADASFFLDEEDISGRRTMQLFYKNVVDLHGAAKTLPRDCVDKMDPSLCFFPKQVIGSIKTPLFLVNPAYDFWQIQHVLVPAASDLPDEWRKCRLNIQYCNHSQMNILQGFRNSLLRAVSEFEKKKDWGVFINSCYIHCQTWMETWHGPNSPRVDNKTIAETISDWYYNKEIAKRVDCPYPCNPSCLNLDFTGA